MQSIQFNLKNRIIVETGFDIALKIVFTVNFNVNNNTAAPTYQLLINTQQL